MALSWYDGNPSEIITVNGSPITLGQGIQTYNLNLDHVTSVSISGVPSDAGYWLADNVNFTAVPEPATWAMMLFGLGVIGSGMRIARRRNVGAPASA